MSPAYILTTVPRLVSAQAKGATALCCASLCVRYFRQDETLFFLVRSRLLSDFRFSFSLFDENSKIFRLVCRRCRRRRRIQTLETRVGCVLDMRIPQFVSLRDSMKNS